MAANYALTGDMEKRVRFFDGQFLQDQDFIDEQKYHLDRVRRHHRLLHVAGIADGLTVSPAGANRVTVAPGTAIDADGRQLVLAQPATADLPAETFNNQRGVRIAIAYRESPVDRQAREGSADDTRWLERPEIVRLGANETYNGPTPPVLLAEVALDNQGTVTVNAGVRQYSGVRLPGPAADPPLLRTTPDGRVGLTGSRLTVSAGAEHLQLRRESTEKSGGKQLFLELLQVDPNGQTVPEVRPSIRFHHSGRFWHRLEAGPDGFHLKEGNLPGDGYADLKVRNLTTTGNLGVGTASTGTRLEVAGAIKFTGDLKTDAMERITPLLLRGTGFNNNGARALVLGSTTVYETSEGRGLTLTVIRKADHAVLWTRTYDTFVSAAAADGLAKDLDRVTRDEIGTLASYDAWEGSVSDNLRAALRRFGLHRAAAIGPGPRRPYAAIFEGGRVSDGAGLAKAVEVLHPDSPRAPFADIRGWLIDGSFVATGNAPNALTNNLGGEPVVVVSESGNVGVGTTSPGTQLTVSAGAEHLQLRRESTEKSGGQQLFLELLQVDPNGQTVPEVRPSIRFHHSGRFWHRIEAGKDGFHVKDGNVPSDSYVDLKARNLAATGNLTTAGNVGVGTASPDKRLTVSAGAEHLQLRRESSEKSGGKQLFLELLQVDPDGQTVPEVRPSIRFHHSGKFWHRIEAGKDGFHLKEGNLPGDGYADLKVGNLEVRGPGGAAVALFVSGRLQSSSDNGGLWVGEDRFIGGHSTNQVGFYSNNAWRLTVLNNGNVGIGTTNPEMHRLSVRGGSTYVEGDLFVNGALKYWWGPDNAWKHVQNRADNWAGSYSTSGPSDLRLKTALRPIDHALGKVLQLRGVRFRWADTGLRHLTRHIEDELSAGPDATREQDERLWEAQRRKAFEALSGDHIGVVAQDLEAVAPELVHQDEDGYKHVRYPQLAALLIEAIKEQNELLHGQSARIAALEAR